MVQGGRNGGAGVGSDQPLKALHDDGMMLQGGSHSGRWWKVSLVRGQWWSVSNRWALQTGKGRWIIIITRVRVKLCHAYIIM